MASPVLVALLGQPSLFQVIHVAARGFDGLVEEVVLLLQLYVLEVLH
jgi:hypothetical protein